MFYRRGFCHDVEVLHFKAVALCAVFCLSTFGPCSMTHMQNPIGYKEHRSYKNDLISGPEDVLVSNGDARKQNSPQTSMSKLSLENICRRADLFCFPSTLSGFFPGFHSEEANISDLSGVKADEKVLVGSTQSMDNFSWSSDHGNFQLISENVVSCSLESKESASADSSVKGDPSIPVDQKEESLRIKSRHVDGFSSVHVQISHPLLDWGQKYLHFPSLAFLTVENRHDNNVLKIFEPYSTNAQFYPCNHSEIELEPGETASICFVFLPKWLGFSSAHLILQTSSGGFVIQAQGFAVQSPYEIQPSVGITRASLLLENDSPDLLTVVKISTVGENTVSLQTKYVEGLILFPYTVTQVAMVTCTPNPCMNLNCRILVQTNKSDAPVLEIPCSDIASLSVWSNSYVGYGVLNYDNVETTSSNIHLRPHLGVKATEMTKADESVLGNWRSQGTESGMSVLNDSEIMFPLVHIDAYQSKWISVVNPSDQPVVMQLLLNSGELINDCREPDDNLQPSPSYTLLLDGHMTPSRYGFSIAGNALTEAYVHPHGTAVLGPIVFHPSSRCTWSSSALVRNNLSGVEWLSLHGSGGSLSMHLLDGPDPVHTVKLNHNYGQPSVKVLFVKNDGDLPLEVNRISISGTKCELDGFVVGGCESFALLPGESRKLIISYRADLCAAMIRRELELAMSGGILVVPMEVSLPTPMLTICKRSVFWTRFKKLILAVLASILLISMTTSCTFSFVIRDGNLSEHERHVSEICLKPDTAQVQASSSPETTKEAGRSSPLSLLSKSVAVEVSKSENLTVKTGKDKAKRRKKKRNSGAGLTCQFEVSSSHSSNSTPSSPLSPLSSFAPKRSPELSPNIRTRDSFKHGGASVVLPAKVKPSTPVKISSRAPGAERKVVKPEGSGTDPGFVYNIWGDHLCLVGQSQVVLMMPTIAEDKSGSLFSVSPQELFRQTLSNTVSFKQDD